MSSPTAGMAQYHFVIRKCTAYWCYLVTSSANSSSQHHGKDISLGIKSADNSLNSVSLESLLVILPEASKKQSPKATQISLQVGPYCSYILLHTLHRVAGGEKGRTTGCGERFPALRPVWKKAQKAGVEEKQPKT